MDTLRSVLKEVQSGTTSFVPASGEEKDMWDFQPIAKILVYAHRNNFLESCVPYMESDTPHGWYDVVIVRGGLTYEGEMFLAKPEEERAEKNLQNIIQLSPNIYGIGVDLRALWHRWKNRGN